MGFNIIGMISNACNTLINFVSEHIIEISLGTLVVLLIVGFMIFVKHAGGI